MDVLLAKRRMVLEQEPLVPSNVVVAYEGGANPGIMEQLHGPVGDTNPKEYDKIKFVPEEKATKQKTIDDIDLKFPTYIVADRGEREVKYLPYNIGRTIIIGASGSGKSVAIDNILRNMDIPRRVKVKKANEIISDGKVVKEAEYETILPLFVYIFCGSTDIDTESNYAQILDSRGINYDYYEFSDIPDAIRDVSKAAELYKNGETNVREHFVMIFDDFDARLKKSADISEWIKKCRKADCQLIFSIQGYQQLPPGIWKNITNVCVFYTTQSELKLILDRIGSTIPKQVLADAYELCVQEPHGFLTIDIANRALFNKFKERIVWK